MDEMTIKLTTKFMRGIVSKLISKAIHKKYGCRVKIQLNDLDFRIIDGETHISTNVEADFTNEEFVKIMKSISSED